MPGRVVGFQAHPRPCGPVQASGLLVPPRALVIYAIGHGGSLAAQQVVRLMEEERRCAPLSLKRSGLFHPFSLGMAQCPQPSMPPEGHHVPVLLVPASMLAINACAMHCNISKMPPKV
jgi:hypothetical protein